MTPTPEEIALAGRVAKTWPTAEGAAYGAALTAIMEVREKVANLVLLEMVHGPDNEIDTTCNALVADLYRAIRNGEHLR